jgi:hypothetical protein
LNSATFKQEVAFAKAHFEATKLFASKLWPNCFLAKASFAEIFKTQFVNYSSTQLEVN